MMLEAAVKYTGGADFDTMVFEVIDTLSRKGKIILYGCGSTGRLSIALVSIYRRIASDLGLDPDSAICTMTGGEGALYQARENHEDSTEFAKNQLDALT